MRIHSDKFYFFASLTLLLALCTTAAAQTVGEGELIAQHSGKCLTVTGGKGTRVQQADCDGSRRQQWRFDPTETKGVYYIVAKLNELVLDVAGEGQANGAPIILWEWHGRANQRWGVKVIRRGVYAFTAAHSGRCLDIEGISQSDGARAHQWDYLGGANQQWELRQAAAPKPPTGTGHSGGTIVFDSNRPDPPQQLVIHQNGGYVARFFVTYQVKGRGFKCASGSLAVGQKLVCEIPRDAENIRVIGQYSTVFAWKELFSQQLSIIDCLETTGTVFSPQVRAVSCN
ncbi:MAG TPA: RICIN domain-containing protein [Blastocatellia bacterium]|nr:RICIN domain-containing protein [Blastocatellia bacterium]